MIAFGSSDDANMSEAIQVGLTLVPLRSWHSAVARDTRSHRPGVLPAAPNTTWMPQPCRWSCMNAASMHYAAVHAVQVLLKSAFTLT
jgi:hypothetical protein